MPQPWRATGLRMSSTQRHTYKSRLAVYTAGATDDAMKANIQIVAFMTPFPYSVDIDDPLTQAHQLMREHHFRHLPVTLAGEIVGMLTDRDTKLMLLPESAHTQEHGLKVRDAHIEQPCIVSASTPVASVARTMADRRTGAAIVVKGSKLVGIFTVTDACRALADALRGPSSESPDAA